MLPSWSKDAGAPAVPAALAAAAGIVAAAGLPRFPSGTPGILLGALCLAGAAVSYRGDRRLFASALLVLVGLVAGRRFETSFLEPARRTEAAAREAGEDSLVELTGRVDRLWTRSGSLFRARVEVASATCDDRPLALERPVTLVVAGREDPSAAVEIGDRIRVRGRLRLPDEPASTRSPFRFPDEPRIVVKSADQIERLGGPGRPDRDLSTSSTRPRSGA